jgi:hypothetical protein
VDEHERADIALRVNGIIRATAGQAQQLIKEYADSQIATVEGLVSLWEQAVVTLEMLSEERNRLLGQACVTDPSKQLVRQEFSSSKGRHPRLCQLTWGKCGCSRATYDPR